MMMASAAVAPPSYYDGLADELESIAGAVKRSPQLVEHFAARLVELARQMREDARLMRAIAS